MHLAKPTRVSHTYRETLHAALGQVFPLLCPVREIEWAVGWMPQRIISASGGVERDCVFLTPDKQGTASWYITRHEPERWFVEMIKILPSVTACRLHIQLSENGPVASPTSPTPTPALTPPATTSSPASPRTTTAPSCKPGKPNSTASSKPPSPSPILFPHPNSQDPA